MEYTDEFFAANLRAERARKGITQSQLAALAGISTGSLNRYETGKAVPTLANACNIAAALGVTLDALLKQLD